MKHLIIILFIILSNLSVNAKDSIVTEVVNINKCTTQIDTVRFVNDTAWVAENPKISHIVYADNSSNSNIIKEYLFPIIMLLLGIGIDRFIVWRSDKKKINKIGKRWFAELRAILEPITKQQLSLTAFVIEYCDKPEQFEIPNIAVFSGASGKTFSSLSKEDLYEYIENIKGKDCNAIYQKICGVIATLELTYKQFIEAKNEFRENGKKLIDEYNSNIQHYRILLNDVASHSGKMDGMNTEDADEIIRIYNEVFKDDGRHCNVFKSIDEFINPSIEILRKYETNDASIQMTHALSSCYDCVIGMENEKIYIKNNFTFACEMYERTKLATNDILTLLDKKK